MKAIKEPRNRQEMILMLREQLITLKSLSQSEGWELFQGSMLAHEQVAHNQMIHSESETITLKAIGAHHIAKVARLWCRDQISALEHQLKMATGEDSQ